MFLQVQGEYNRFEVYKREQTLPDPFSGYIYLLFNNICSVEHIITTTSTQIVYCRQFELNKMRDTFWWHFGCPGAQCMVLIITTSNKL